MFRGTFVSPDSWSLQPKECKTRQCLKHFCGRVRKKQKHFPSPTRVNTEDENFTHQRDPEMDILIVLSFCRPGWSYGVSCDGKDCASGKLPNPARDTVAFSLSTECLWSYGLISFFKKKSLGRRRKYCCSHHLVAEGTENQAVGNLPHVFVAPQC